MSRVAVVTGVAALLAQRGVPETRAVEMAMEVESTPWVGEDPVVTMQRRTPEDGEPAAGERLTGSEGEDVRIVAWHPLPGGRFAIAGTRRRA